MQMLVDADFILEALLNRKDFSADAKKAFDIIQSGQIRAKITQLGLEKIYSVVSKQAGNEAAAEIVAEMRNFLEVCLVDDTRIQEARLLKLKDPESAIEVACAVANGDGYILTLCPENFFGVTLDVWSVERLLNFRKLERSLLLSDLSSQLASQEVESVNLDIISSKTKSADQQVKLSNFLKGEFPEDWQNFEKVFKTTQFAFRTAKSKVERVKKFDLGDYSLALTLDVTSTSNDEVDIILKLYALNAFNQPILLPINSKLIVLDDSEKIVYLAQSRMGDIGVFISLSADKGDSFQVRVEHENHTFIKDFVV